MNKFTNTDIETKPKSKKSNKDTKVTSPTFEKKKKGVKSKEWADWDAAQLACRQSLNLVEFSASAFHLLYMDFVKISDLAFEEDPVVKANAMGEIQEVVNAAIVRGCPQPKGDARDGTGKRLPVYGSYSDLKFGLLAQICDLAMKGGLNDLKAIEHLADEGAIYLTKAEYHK